MSKAERFNKDHSIQGAMNVFWKKGYKRTSLSDLTHVMGIGKGSFYNTFKSKRALFELCISAYRDYSLYNLKDKLYAEKDVKKGLRNFLITTLVYAIDDDEKKGCLITNTCSEMAGSDAAINQTMNDHYAKMKTIITAYLKQGSDLQSHAIKEIADTIITFFIGMTIEVKLQNDKRQIEQSINRLIESLF